MSSYAGKILRVNLTNGSIRHEALPFGPAREFLGGRGLGGKLLADEIPAGIDPLGEENKIFFVTGPLTGTSAPTGGRYMVVTKSPLNNTIASSNSGGFWGAELKFAGYDLLVVEGRAKSPVWLYIRDSQVEIRPADRLWGMTSNEVTDALLSEVGDRKARVLNIGPAGENLSRIAAVINDRWRAAGRSGVGAVMGAKNLKAIVVRGSGKVEAANGELFRETVSRSLRKIKENGVTGQGLPAYGTAILVNIINEHGIYPTNNFQTGVFPQAEATSGETLAEKYLKKKDPCFRCPIACERYCSVDGEEGGGPEYETVWAYGADCGISDLKAIIRANNVCNEMGLDTISAGATIAAAMELYQRGRIRPEELDIDSLGVCLFTSFALGAEDYAGLYNAATGESLSVEQLLACGDRIFNNERLFNLAEGYTARDDTLPKRLLEEPMPAGPSKGHVHPLDKMLPKYYEVRGWAADGVPTREKKAALGL